MSINLRESDRDQLFLLPPSIVDWLSDDHLAFFVLDVVAELDLAAFYADYRSDGRGGAAYDPAIVLAILIYAYCVGEHSSRRIERRLTEDVAFRVVAAKSEERGPTSAPNCCYSAKFSECLYVRPTRNRATASSEALFRARFLRISR
jgi:hypothetical protein